MKKLLIQKLAIALNKSKSDMPPLAFERLLINIEPILSEANPSFRFHKFRSLAKSEILVKSIVNLESGFDNED